MSKPKVLVGAASFVSMVRSQGVRVDRAAVPTYNGFARTSGRFVVRPGH
jgi:hypothetical protein